MKNKTTMAVLAGMLENASQLLREHGNTREARVLVRQAYEVLDVAVEEEIDAPYPSARVECTGIVFGFSEDGRRTLTIPFHPEVIPALRSPAINGLWDRELGTWVFSADTERKAISDIVEECYGTCLEEDTVVDILLPITTTNEAVALGAGRVLVERRRLGGKIVLGRGVTLVSGGFENLPPGQRDPALLPLPDTVIKVEAVPIQRAEEMVRTSTEVSIL